jgi:hypothetical protein
MKKAFESMDFYQLNDEAILDVVTRTFDRFEKWDLV